MNKKIKKIIFTIITGILCILCLCVKLTGGIPHVIFGMLLLIVSVVHVIRNRDRMKYVPQKMKLVDKALCVILGAVFLTGMLLHPLHDMMIISILHKLTSVMFMIGCVVHVVQHCKLSEKEGI